MKLFLEQLKFLCWCYMATSSWSSISRMWVHFLMTHFLQQQSVMLLHKKHQSISSSEHLFFFWRLYQLDISVLTLDFFSHLVANLFPSFCPFVVLFWMLQMLVTMSKWCHVPHALPVTTWRTVFLETFFVSARNESNLGHLLSC